MRFCVPAALLPVLLLAVSVVLLPSPATATTLADVSLRDVAHRSPMVVVARVGGQQAVDAPAGSLSTWETHTELSVERYLKGDGPDVLVVRQLGRLTDPSGSRVVDDARLIPGSRVLLFLRAPRDGMVHLSLLGYAAYTLSSAGGHTLALPHARLPHPHQGSHRPDGDTAPSPPRIEASGDPALGAPTTLAALERFLGASR